jgi:NADPH:quinone reductase-like Zn-dependent oxidoreductase
MRERIVSTASASQVGRMLVRLGHHFGIGVVCVVRRAAQIELLHSLGASHVLNSADPQFDAHLRELCAGLDARLAFDAVGGEMTERLRAALPRAVGSRCMAGSACSRYAFSSSSPSFEGKGVDGFWIPTSGYAEIEIRRKMGNSASGAGGGLLCIFEREGHDQIGLERVG